MPNIAILVGNTEYRSLPELECCRADVVAMKRQQSQHSVLLGTVTEDVARLNGDVSVLKADVAELKLDVAGLLVLMRETLRGLQAGS